MRVYTNMPKGTVQPDTSTNGQGGTLADILVTLGALEKTRAEQVKMAEIQSGSTQEEIIKKGNLVPEGKLVEAKAQLYNIPYVDLDTIPVAPEALAALPSEVAQRFNVFPISVQTKDKTLNLAIPATK